MYVCLVQISSLHNAKIKQLIKLQQKSRERNLTKSFVVEGLQENRLAISNKYDALHYFVQEDLFDASLDLSHVEVFKVSQEVFDKIAYRNSTGGILGVYKTKTNDLNSILKAKNPLIVVLEAIEKPGNLGAVLRTCDAAKVDAVIVCDGLVDFFNPNVIRSSVGTLFTNNLISSSKESFIEFCKKYEIQVLATFLKDESKNLYEMNLKKPTALVFGTEATGLSEFWFLKSDASIKIPMLGQVDSLNVSNSVAITLYEAVRQRDFAD